MNIFSNYFYGDSTSLKMYMYIYIYINIYINNFKNKYLKTIIIKLRISTMQTSNLSSGKDNI